jgi:hypothetical protein
MININRGEGGAGYKSFGTSAIGKYVLRNYGSTILTKLIIKFPSLVNNGPLHHYKHAHVGGHWNKALNLINSVVTKSLSGFSCS